MSLQPAPLEGKPISEEGFFSVVWKFYFQNLSTFLVELKLSFSGDTGTGSVNDAQDFSITGDTSIKTTALDQGLTIELQDSITVNDQIIYKHKISIGAGFATLIEARDNRFDISGAYKVYLVPTDAPAYYSFTGLTSETNLIFINQSVGTATIDLREGSSFFLGPDGMLLVNVDEFEGVQQMYQEF